MRQNFTNDISMKKNIFLLFALFCSLLVSAQNYVVDNIYSDSIDVFAVKVTAGRDSVLKSERVFKIANGDQIAVERAARGDSLYAIFQKGSTFYAAQGWKLLLSDSNPEGTIDPFNTLSRKEHTFGAHLYMTMIPYWIVALLFAVAILMTWLGNSVGSLRKAALMVVPLCIFVASLIEIGAAYYVGGDAFWWCDQGKYGFWGSLVRAIPFMAFVAFQLFSFKFYGKLLYGRDSDDKISIKPMAISLAACLPVLIVVSIACILAKLDETLTVILSLLSFLLSLGVGVWMSVRRNVRQLGKTMGLLLSAFSFVYIIGSIVAIYGLAIVLLKLIIQILIICAAIALVGFAMSSSGGSGGGNSSGGSSQRVWLDDHGGRHITEIDARAANERIARAREE